MSTDSAARALAATLEALARHLQAHLHLSHVNLSRAVGRVDLQVSSFPHLGEPDATTALVAWAESLPEHTMTVKVIDGEAYVCVAATLGGFPVQVWSTVRGLAKQLEVTPEQAGLTVEDLRVFVTAGHLPGRAD